MTDGSAVLLPTVTYLGAEFVPAFTSAGRLATWLGQEPEPPFAAMPHIVVPAAELARRMPAGVGIALNPGAEASVPIYPEGVGCLAAALVVSDGTQVRVGRPPADPLPLLGEVRSALSAMPGVRQASRAWLSVAGQGEGLVISVTLDHPGSQAAHQQVVDAGPARGSGRAGTGLPDRRHVLPARASRTRWTRGSRRTPSPSTSGHRALDVEAEGAQLLARRPR